MLDQVVEILLEKWIKLYRQTPLITAALTILSIVGTVAGGILIYEVEKERQDAFEAKRLENQDYSKQLESLNLMSSNLKGLLDFVDGQRKQLKQTEDTLTSMKNEHEKIKPLVEVDKKVIDALFAAQEARNQEAQKGERWIGFGWGVGASFIASLLWALTSHLIRRQKMKEPV